MSLPIDIINLVLYFVQQLGVMLGVGAATVLLIAYLVAKRDRVFDLKEQQFGRAVHKVMILGITLMIVSGLAITGIHLYLVNSAVVFTPAYLFKWTLLVLILGGEALRSKNVFTRPLGAGFLGANWYALFVLHILAPVALWADLLVLYSIWVAGFTLSFMALSGAMSEENPVQEKVPDKKPQPLAQIKKLAPALAASMPKLVAPKPAAPPPPPAPKPVVVAAPPPPKPAAPTLPHKPLEVPKPAVAAMVPHIAPKKPAEIPLPKKPPTAPLKKFEGELSEPDLTSNLPHVQVMPKTPEELAQRYAVPAKPALQLAQ